MKSGIKSSEFWMTILMAAAGGAYSAAGQSDDPLVIVGLQILAALYTAARTYLKAKTPELPVPPSAADPLQPPKA